ncbi:hypothetical protein NP493_315g04062 [Ridgeia piscesae]|uniref:Aminopeptidase N n=1 Tax=Ridgeia piscesae TaxID=27915 RepID=A0AAD9NW05_RIDPI|nr:hypothetical protein NP493_315g04062 [Ridgeia piscesae]
MEQFVVIDLLDVLKIDSLSSSHPIYVPVSHPDEINQIFDSISYGKGASVIRMMYNYLGEETFKKGLSNYLKKHQYDTATHKDLWDALNQQAKADNKTANVAAIMDTWILQMGYPVVTVTRNMDAGTAQVTQSRFLLDPVQKPSTTYTSPFSYKWMVPFTYVVSSSPTWNEPPAVFMNMTDVTLTGLKKDDWIIGNIGHSGVYRVNYDGDNWQKLIEQLHTDHTVIPEQNRAQIIDDAFNLGRSGILDQVVAFKVTAYLKNEVDFTPWRTVFRNLAYIELMLDRTATRGLYEKYILRLIEPMYRTIKWDESTNSTHLEIYLRTMMLRVACLHGERDCVNNATALFRQWMDNPTDNRIPADLKQTVYCTALKHGGLEEWNFAYKQYTIANVAVEKHKLLRSLSCSSKPWVLNSLLLRTLNKNDIRKQDIASVIASVSRTDIGRYIVWNFVRANWDTIKGTLDGIFGIRRLTGFIAQGFNTQYELEELDEFGARHPEIGVSSTAFRQRREETLANIRWMADNQHKIHEWLEKTTL